MGNFNFQWTEKPCTRIFLLNHIAFFFTLFKGYKNTNITPRKRFLWEPAKINVKFHRNWENTHAGEIVKVRFLLVKFEGFQVYFLGLSWKPFLRSYFVKLITLIALEKCKKEGAMWLKLFWYKVFVPWKLKLLLPSILTSLRDTQRGYRYFPENCRWVPLLSW